MSEINKEWVQNVGLELADSSNCPLYACTQCPNGTIHCDECFAIFMKKHAAKVRTEAIEEFVKALEEHQQKNWTDNLEYGITFADIEEVAEQLKEDK